MSLLADVLSPVIVAIAHGEIITPYCQRRTD